ncbi:MAG TPA: hypothetical protein PKM82_06685 [Acidovorax sp.]|nr:hypothetical protein [Acidovorax sp.]
MALMHHPRLNDSIAINYCINARIQTPFRQLLLTHCTSHASQRRLLKAKTVGGLLQGGAGNSQCTTEVQPLQLRHSTARSGVPSEGPRRHLYQQPHFKHPTRCILFQALAIPAPFSCLCTGHPLPAAAQQNPE